MVDPRYRRIGVGSSLLNQIPLANLNSLTVDTPLMNEGAIRFYEDQGFETVDDMPEDFTKTWIRLSKKL